MSTAKTLASIAAPAPQVVQEPTVQVKQQSAKQKARIDKGLAETKIEAVRVDGLVSRLFFGTPRANSAGQGGARRGGRAKRSRFISWEFNCSLGGVQHLEGVTGLHGRVSRITQYSRHGQELEWDEVSLFTILSNFELRNDDDRD